MKDELEGKVALVTGAATGIGRATALAFGRARARVVVTDVAPAGEETAAVIREDGGDAQFLRCDVSNPDQVAAAVAEVVRRYGRLDCAFNNAGIEGTQALLGDYPIEVWNHVLAVNLTGVMLCMKSEIAAMAPRGGGAIVNNASILGQVGFATACAYVAAKHGVIGLTRTAALEYADKGIRVNAVCPGFIETPMLERAGLTTNIEARASLEALHPIRRLGRPEEIADAVLWLCSPRASFVTGHPLFVDGGYVAR
ncbi:MAG TPA: SDR family oxidoreductase [Polyangia bacterium]|nr:SDR family oxidoreductase [Polyangia bacterium]